MPRVLKKYPIAENTRNRVRIFRGIQSILKEENDRMNFIRTRNVEHIFTKQRTEQNSSLADKLRAWALEFNVTKRAISSLLKLLKCSGMNYLPKDSRTLLQTPRMIHIENIAGGKYCSWDLVWYGKTEMLTRISESTCK